MFFERLEVSEAYRSSPSLAKRLMFVDQRRSRRPEGHGRGSWMLGHGRFDRFAAVLAPEGASATRVSSSIRFDSGRPERPPNMSSSTARADSGVAAVFVIFSRAD